jgi:hypothetical protein
MSWGSLAGGLFLLVLGAAGGYFAHSTQAAKPTVYIFDDKRFMNSPDFVYAAGTRTGQSISYPDNTWAIGCYREKMECWTASVEGISTDSCQIGRVEWPSYMPVTKWTDDVIEAADELSPALCRKTTLSIDRRFQTVVFVVEPLNVTSSLCAGASTTIDKSTLENSRWQRVMFGKGGH